MDSYEANAYSEAEIEAGTVLASMTERVFGSTLVLGHGVSDADSFQLDEIPADHGHVFAVTGDVDALAFYASLQMSDTSRTALSRRMMALVAGMPYRGNVLRLLRIRADGFPGIEAQGRPNGGVLWTVTIGFDAVVACKAAQAQPVNP